MEAGEMHKSVEHDNDYRNYEDGSMLTDAFELLNPDDHPEDQRKTVEEFNRRAELGNRRYRLDMYRAEILKKVFNFSMYIDMSDGTYMVTSTDKYTEKIKNSPNAFQFLRDNVDFSVHQSFRNELKEWFQPETISALLEENDTASKDFLAIKQMPGIAVSLWSGTEMQTEALHI